MTKEERANWVPQPGDEVVIREWDDMAKEFGYIGTSNWIINCDFLVYKRDEKVLRESLYSRIFEKIDRRVCSGF